MQRIRSLFLSKKIPEDLRLEFIRQLSFTNFNRCKIFAPALLVLFIILAAADLFNWKKGLLESTGFHGLFGVHGGTVIFLILAICAFYIRPPRTAAGITLRHRIAVFGFAFLLILSAVVTVLVDQFIHGQISSYVIVTLGLGACILMRKTESSVLYAVSLTLFLGGMGYVQHDPRQLLGHYLNGTLLTLIAWLLSMIVYAAYKQNFLHVTTIEKQNENIRVMNEKIRLTETGYRQLVEHSPMGVFRATATGTVLAANEALLRILGFGSTDELNYAGLFNLYAQQSDCASPLGTGAQRPGIRVRDGAEAGRRRAHTGLRQRFHGGGSSR